VGAFQELLGWASLLRTGNNITVNNKRKLVSDKAGRGRQVEIDCNLEMEASTGSDRENDHGIPAYGGWVYHMGTHSVGYQYFHARYLVIRGKYVTMFKRDPVEHPRAVSSPFAPWHLGSVIPAHTLSLFVLLGFFP
jgi:hypothetical protein